MTFDYSNAPYRIPDYKADAHRGAWQYMARPGSWWKGTERLAIAAASRAAHDCELCRERKAALSPNAVSGSHDGPTGGLPDKVIGAVHRITTDPARLTRTFVDGLLADDFSYGHYVEMVSLIVNLISIDSLHEALGLPLEPLPEPEAGDPDGYLPPGAAVDVAWVPMIYPENLSDREDDIYLGAPRMGHVIRAMSLVPDAVRWLNNLSVAHYLPLNEVGDFSKEGKLTLSRMQTELVASRTSYYNDCFY